MTMLPRKKRKHLPFFTSRTTSLLYIFLHDDHHVMDYVLYHLHCVISNVWCHFPVSAHNVPPISSSLIFTRTLVTLEPLSFWMYLVRDIAHGFTFIQCLQVGWFDHSLRVYDFWESIYENVKNGELQTLKFRQCNESKLWNSHCIFNFTVHNRCLYT